MPYRSILVPTDFSPQATVALQAAVDLARAYEAKLTLLHVYAAPGYIVPEGFIAASPQVMLEVLGAVEKSLKGLRERTEGPGLKVEAISVQGGPVVEICRQAEEGKHDLIVMGTHGHTGVRRLFLGSVAERVVREASCPVLVVRPQSAA